MHDGCTFASFGPTCRKLSFRVHWTLASLPYPLTDRTSQAASVLAMVCVAIRKSDHQMMKISFPLVPKFFTIPHTGIDRFSHTTQALAELRTKISQTPRRVTRKPPTAARWTCFLHFALSKTSVSEGRFRLIASASGSFELCRKAGMTMLQLMHIAICVVVEDGNAISYSTQLRRRPRRLVLRHCISAYLFRCAIRDQHSMNCAKSPQLNMDLCASEEQREAVGKRVARISLLVLQPIPFFRCGGNKSVTRFVRTLSGSIWQFPVLCGNANLHIPHDGGIFRLEIHSFRSSTFWPTLYAKIGFSAPEIVHSAVPWLRSYRLAAALLFCSPSPRRMACLDCHAKKVVTQDRERHSVVCRFLGI
ncbi:methyltransferase [Pseudozyma hubeiensis SY62]|uniref:Methyltransferase n=1 Tax=Pseudozyma hubeiensis (strain SY62) TaxID=1305764 RepID=R9NZJ5_PSEHS|nr:methyltransferase [Pseudozyma hubeiensis SY62]GAC94142.1 methyltransferase [Pseudozyma hubeiensis SY62]